MESCRKVVREKVLNEMLGSIQDNTGGGWKIMILDAFTTRVLSSTLKMSDILDCNVSMVEDLAKAREPCPLIAVYFIQPISSSISQLIADFTGPAPLYHSVHIFFSSKVSSEAMAKIKACGPLLKVLKTLKEGNLEFLTIDDRTLITEHPAAAVALMSDNVEVAVREAEKELDGITRRLVTLMASLHEFPVIRYKAGRTPEAGDPPGSMARSTLTKRLSQKLLASLTAMRKDGQLPDKETCDVLILDRSYDPVAPIIHEWTYEAIVHDILHMDGSTYKYHVDSASGKSEEKEATLEEIDPLWRELRHLFIADVYSTLGARFKEFQSKNKAAKLGGGGVKADMSSSNIRALIQALPEFREVLSKLSLHIQVSSDLKTSTTERHLTEVGELEQDLVLGEKNSKDLIAFLSDKGADLDPTDKMRLFMCYCATHPEKLDVTKRAQWAKLAKLDAGDMAAVCNLIFMGCSVMKPGGDKAEKTGFFGGKKAAEKKDLLRRKKDEDGGFALFRFQPLLHDILSDMVAGRLPKDEFPYIQVPTTDPSEVPTAAQSARTARSGLTWAKRNAGDGTAGSGPAHRRLVVFVVGGAVRSEMRVVHELSQKLKRDIILASTSIENPHSFIDMLAQLNTSNVDYGA